MEMQDIGINLSSDVVKALTSYGERCGWSLEETIRFIIGEYVGSRPYNFLTSATSQPSPSPLSPNTAELSEASNELIERAERLTKQQMWLASASGVLKCRNCSQPLATDDLEIGKCSKCATPL